MHCTSIISDPRLPDVLYTVLNDQFAQRVINNHCLSQKCLPALEWTTKSARRVYALANIPRSLVHLVFWPPRPCYEDITHISADAWHRLRKDRQTWTSNGCWKAWLGSFIFSVNLRATVKFLPSGGAFLSVKASVVDNLSSCTMPSDDLALVASVKFAAWCQVW